jgi:hypothetical protein
LEQGLKTFPASLGAKERFIKIAELVDGKTAKDCYGRFKELIEKLKQEKP